jgi:tRNA-splicing ligase RtcB
MRRLLLSNPCVTRCYRRHCGTTKSTEELQGSFSILRAPESRVDVHAWVENVEVERTARDQIMKLAQMGDIIRHPIAAMPDIHFGNGTTVGTVIPTTRAVIPASVGVDIGCGMLAMKTTLTAADIPSRIAELRLAIEVAVPHGRTHNGKETNDAGSWRSAIPDRVAEVWKKELEPRFKVITAKREEIARSNHINHLGTLGTGNHFIELCLDEQQYVWVMIHSGSRGVGGRIGSIYIELAKKEMGQLISRLPDANFAYLREGTPSFDDYVEAVGWAQDYARWNRCLMGELVLDAMRSFPGMKTFSTVDIAVNCHHNYVEHTTLPCGDPVWITRKGATSARAGELAVIPGSMGAKSYIVRGKGNARSYNSCSHGAGRKFSRGESTRRFTLEDHERATAGVECRKDKDVLDETPMAYKDVDAVMHAQRDLVEVVHTLKQFLCVKG